jgi:cell wall-associated NlpC family hydrolase
MKKHWAIDYIGLPWVAGGLGPDEFDCWGLVINVYSKFKGIDLPRMPGVDPRNPVEVYKEIAIRKKIDACKNMGVYQVEDPQEFDIALLGRSNRYHHVGLFTEESGTGIVHCSESSGVVFESRSQLKIQRYNKILYFRHGKSNPHN